MTFEKFLKRNKLIAEYLAQIALHRDAVGWVDSAMPLDASFRDVLAAQERLLTAAERLLESCTANVRADATDSAASAEADASTVTAMPQLRAAESAGLVTTH
ncbi:MAG: hypothetical protein JWR16_2140 [Nevskia sp.]|nr:hypothetical protein [Nevskia sp.]